MKEQIKKFWNDKKESVKTIAIVVLLPLAGIAVYGLTRKNEIEENVEEVKEISYGEVDEITEEEA